MIRYSGRFDVRIRRESGPTLRHSEPSERHIGTLLFSVVLVVSKEQFRSGF